ncbi:hypothetical protein T09_15373 [Trichinella sp. T9]|nr:hypothetical protein T09_15373 [Trichinella sp. T9]
MRRRVLAKTMFLLWRIFVSISFSGFLLVSL